MAKKLDKEYCLWKTNCLVFGLGQDLEGCEKYRCCYNCNKKSECEFACKDRNGGSHTCSFLISKEEAEAKTIHTAPIFSATKLKESKAPSVEAPQQLSDETSRKSKQKKTTAPKALWTMPLPTTVKELAAQTGSTYARANYLIKTKKLSFKEALEILKK